MTTKRDRLIELVQRGDGAGMEYQARLVDTFLANEAAERNERLERLTKRERELVGMLVEGKSTHSMSLGLELTVSTVNTYLKRIFSKLGVHSRVELVAFVNGAR